MSTPCILVVDDQPINVQLLKRKLEREGIRVLTATNGVEALAAIGKEKPDLILLDVMMPDMDGIEVCQRLQGREDTRSIPIIFITSYEDDEVRARALNTGAVDYFLKPFDDEDLLNAINAALKFKIKRK